MLLLLLLGFAQKAEVKPKHPLVGVWTLQYQGANHPVVCYKILKKNGKYINLRSTDWEGKHFLVSRMGKYAAGIGGYVERLEVAYGYRSKSPVNFPLKYDFLGKDTVKISYNIDGNECEEIWHRAEKAPRVLICIFPVYRV